MNEPQTLIDSIYAGWRSYRQLLIEVFESLQDDQLALRAAPHLRSIAENATHVVGARAYWFYQLMGEGGEEFKSLGRWDRRGAKPRSAGEIVDGLETTWKGMHEAISSWTEEDWKKTWPGPPDGEPEVITRGWVIWHLIEHDLHHGGEISLTLGIHGIQAVAL